MTKFRRTQFLLVSVTILMMLVSGCACNKVVNQPLAPTLALTTNKNTPEATSTLPPVESPADPSPTAAGICGTSGSFSILMLGTGPNIRAGFANETDFIRIVGVNYDQKSLRVLSMNEGLELNTPVFEPYQVNTSQIIAIYPRGYKNEIGSELQKQVAGVNAMAQTLYDNFSYKADHYILIHQEPLMKMIDQIGGIDVPVSEAFAGSHAGYAAGVQHFDGARTFDYITRLDKGDSEQDRVLRQNQVFGIVLNRVLDISILNKIPDLITAFHGSIVTDMSISELVNLACLFSNVPSDQIVLRQIPEEMYTLNASELFTPDFEKINSLIREIID